MEFSFGIITASSKQVLKIIESIESMSIPKEKYEIIVVGGENKYDNFSKVVHIPFDENSKPMWITRKKNEITKNAKYENIVYLHDYFFFDPMWYKEFLVFGNDWDVCMNSIMNDGARYRDWCFFPGFLQNFPATQKKKDELFGGGCFLLPYGVLNKHLYKYMYISGGYWVSKKRIMTKYPLDESLLWGQGEDVKWCKEIFSNEISYKVNSKSIVSIEGKVKQNIFAPIGEKHIEYLNSLK